MSIEKSPELDEYGFIVVSEAWRKQRHKQIMRIRNLVGGSLLGYRSVCKDLCRHLPHSHVGIRRKKPEEFFCITCECIMKCARCRCCGCVGRKRPRYAGKWRKAQVKRID